jgi:diphthine-ammonia ligase
MEVAILYSGGKDSTLAIEYCKKRGWDIKYLLSVKPSRRDCYLFHFATVEHTPETAEAMGFPHILLGCDVSDPKLEAQIVKEAVEKNPVDAVVLGGVGLQETQIKSVRDALFDLGIEVFATHKDQNEEQIMEHLINSGYEVIFTEIAAEGFEESWLGKKLTHESLAKLKEICNKYSMSLTGEGGMFNTLTVDGPIFDKKLVIEKSEKVMESELSGYLKVLSCKLVNKIIEEKTFRI